MFDKCFNFTEAKEAIKAGKYPYFIPMSGSDGTVAEYQGHKLIMCGSNNYLGLTTHPDVRKAAKDAVERFGTSCTGSRFLNGTLELHEQLERELADWVGKPAALVFSTGMQVNLGTISALVGRQDIVVLDKDDHASIVDGARLSWGKIERFQHNDMADLGQILTAIPETSGKLVIVDGVFSMEGDIAPLPDLVKVCKKHGARLMVDDAHAIGVLGKGKGTAAHFGITKEVDLIMGTFSKSLASVGGFIAGDEDVIHYVKHFARSFIFSASISPANAAAALASLKVMRQEPERVERVNKIADRMRKAFRELGFNVGHSKTPIIPIFIGDTSRTFLIWKLLFQAGIFVNPTIPPAVPEGKQLLRTSFMATHTEEQLSQVLKTFETVGKQVGLI
ncbi:MAG: pyridoxal phosphate-dependent aminotransferase family protein [Chloroflexota bacterium]